jgi:beta-glucosidase
MADLGIQAYRFSIAWPRIQPEGRGAPNGAGLDFYRGLVEALHRHQIRPVATLYHWDLPQALEDAGGWTSRDVAHRFAEYAGIVARALGDEVPMWITVNEPWVSAWLGYGTGVHAPGRRDDVAALEATHHLLLGHGLAVQAIRSNVAGPAEVGIALNLHPARPASDRVEDVEAARRVDGHANRLYLDPLWGRGYPRDVRERYAHATDFGFVRGGDLDVVAAPLDFLGVNYYTPHTVTGRRPDGPGGVALPESLDAWSVVPAGVPTTAMGWAIQPDGLTEVLMRLAREYGDVPVFVTENGAAFDDEIAPEGRVHDVERVRFLRDHLLAAGAALESGVPLAGYFVWSLLDNFEWAEGYSKRFGIVFVDYRTLDRIPKDSAFWYADVITRSAV